MDTSKLEILGPKILKKIISLLYKQLLKIGSENPKVYNLGDGEVYESIESTLRFVGFGDSESIDVDFVFALYKMNHMNIQDGEIIGELIKPKISTYRFDIDVEERVYQTNTWTHQVDSYLEDNVIPISQYLESEGGFDIFDGNVTYTSTDSSDIIDIRWDRRSIDKIK